MQLTWLIVSTHLKWTLEVEQTLSKSPTIKNLLVDSMSFQQVTVLTHHQHSEFFKDEDFRVTLYLPGMWREFYWRTGWGKGAQTQWHALFVRFIISAYHCGTDSAHANGHTPHDGHMIRRSSNQGGIVMPAPSGREPPKSDTPPPGTLRAVLNAVEAFWCRRGRYSEMVNSKDEPRSASRGNPQCKDIRDVMHNVSQQRCISPIWTPL